MANWGILQYDVAKSLTSSVLPPVLLSLLVFGDYMAECLIIHVSRIGVTSSANFSN